MNPRRWTFAINLVGLLLPPVLRAQEAEPKSPVERPIEAPVILNGQRPSLILPSDEIRKNVLSGGVAFTGIFNDTGLSTSTGAVGHFSYLVQPYLDFAQSRPRVDWDVSLASALIVHQKATQDNQAAVGVNLALKYRLTPYATLQVQSAFDDTTGLFSTISPALSASDIGVVEQANNPLLVPFTQRTMTSSNIVELNYQVDPRSILGARGVYARTDFPGSSKNSQFGPLYSSQMHSGEIFYDYQLSTREWLGVALRRQSFDTESLPWWSTTTDSCLLFYSVTVAPRFTLAFFAGPERFDGLHPALLTKAGGVRQWSVAEGATLTRGGARTSFVAEFSRQVSDSGGLSSAVMAQIADAQLRQQLSSRRELRLGFTYHKSDPLVSTESIRGFLARLEFQQRLTKNLFGAIGYGHERQDRLTGLGTDSANVAWVSLSFGPVRNRK